MKNRFKITGLDCPNCASKLVGMIEKCEGIDSAKINFLSEKLTVESSLDAGSVLEIAKKTAKAFSPDITVE